MLDDVWTRESQYADFVDFRAAGTAAQGTFRCSACGYGVTVNDKLPRCPMCGGETWEAES